MLSNTRKSLSSGDVPATKSLWRLPAFLTVEHPFPWLFPAAALMAVFGIYPLIYSVWLSFHRRNPVTRKLSFDPLYNWEKLLFDERFWNALGNTLLYTGAALLFELGLGLLIALLLDSDRRGYGFLRGLLTLPLVIPPAVTAMMFLLMLNGSFGVVSAAIYEIGLLPPSHVILGQSSTAMAGVLLAEVWQWTPFMVLMMLAGLRSLPKEPFEAAAIDGATAFQAFTRLTLPMISKVISIAVLIRGIDLMRSFDYVKVMTDSGPGTATELMTSYAGRVYFGTADFSYASTIALATLIVIVVCSTGFMRLFKVRL